MSNSEFKNDKEVGAKVEAYNVTFGTEQTPGGSDRMNNVNESEFNLWARQLVPFLEADSVIFASYGLNGFVKIKLLSVVQKIKEIGLFECADSVNFMPQPNFVRVKFDSPSNAETFKNTVFNLDEFPIMYVSKLNIIDSCFISVSNLPADLILKYVAPQLMAWGQIIKIIPQEIPKSNGKSMQIGQTKFEFKFKKDCSINDIPYFIKVLTFKVHLYIRGRKKICFRCHSGEHLVSGCPLRYCGVCRALRDLSHTCIRSYASVATAVSESQGLPDLHDKLLPGLEDVILDAVVQDLGCLDRAEEMEVVKVHLVPDQSPGVVEVLEATNVSLKDDSAGVAVHLPKRMRMRNISKIEALSASQLELVGNNKDLGQGSPPIIPRGIKKVKLDGAGSVKVKNKKKEDASVLLPVDTVVGEQGEPSLDNVQSTLSLVLHGEQTSLLHTVPNDSSNFVSSPGDNGGDTGSVVARPASQ